VSGNLFLRNGKGGRGPALAAIGGALVVGVLAGALLYSWWTGRPAKTNISPTAENRSPEENSSGGVTLSESAQRNGGVKVEAARWRNMASVLTATGVIGPDQSRVAHMRVLGRGLVEKVHVQLGDRVVAGDPLVEYDNVELGLLIGEYLSAKADLDRALTDLEVKRTILARSERMLEVGATARTTHDIRTAEFRDAQAKVTSARALVTKVEEQIHRFGLTDEDLEKLSGTEKEGGLHRTESHSTLRAPFAGIITSYNVAAGERVDPSDSLMTITDISTVWVLADVYERDLGQVKVGRAVRVRVASYPGETFHGRITYIGDVIEPETRTAKVRCVVANQNFKLKLEMFASIEIPAGEARKTLAVPAAAIQQVEGRPVVFVERSPSKFEKRIVETGVEDRGWIEIRSGLQPGERVVTQGSFYLKAALLRELIGGEE